MTSLTQERARVLFDYNPETGNLTWRERPVTDFSCEGMCRWWNRQYAGTKAGCVHQNGYEYVGIDGRQHRSHRIIFLHVHGYMPDEVDHDNQIRSDNRIQNLKPSERKSNGRNRGLFKNSTSGVMGVSWSEKRKKWCASIRVDGKSINLGRFSEKSEAIAARKAAEIGYGFHANHGAPREEDFAIMVIAA